VKTTNNTEGEIPTSTRTTWSVARYEKELAEAKADVERLRVALQSCYWATITYDGNYVRACDSVATIAINALKTQDNK
jgi:hypothetical protein